MIFKLKIWMWSFLFMALLFVIGCKAQKAIVDNEPKVFNNMHFNKMYSEIATFNLKNEPNLIGVIDSFKLKNSNLELEDKVILEFLKLQRCNIDAEAQFQDYPNELQSIFDFYNSMKKEDIEWLNGDELVILKFSSISFIVKYAHNVEATEHLKTQLDQCREDKNYARFVMSSSNLNDCIDKRR